MSTSKPNSTFLLSSVSTKLKYNQALRREQEANHRLEENPIAIPDEEVDLLFSLIKYSNGLTEEEFLANPTFEDFEKAFNPSPEQTVDELAETLVAEQLKSGPLSNRQASARTERMIRMSESAVYGAQSDPGVGSTLHKKK